MTEIEKAIRERLTSPDFLPSTRVLAVTSAQPENLVLAPFRLVAIIDAERAEVRRLRETSDRQAQELRACATEKEEAERAHALEVRRLSEELATVTGQRDAAREALRHPWHADGCPCDGCAERKRAIGAP